MTVPYSPPLSHSFSLSLSCRSIKHGRTGKSDEEKRQRVVTGLEGERETVRGCLNTESVQSGMFAALRVSERASKRLSGSKDKRWWVGVADSGLIWLSASAIVPKLAYCTPPWQYTLVTCTQVLSVYRRMRSCAWHYLSDVMLCSLVST